MGDRIIDTNPHLQSQENMILMMAKSAVESSAIEGITISLEEALIMAREAIIK